MVAEKTGLVNSCLCCSQWHHVDVLAPFCRSTSCNVFCLCCRNTKMTLQICQTTLEVCRLHCTASSLLAWWSQELPTFCSLRYGQQQTLAANLSVHIIVAGHACTSSAACNLQIVHVHHSHILHRTECSGANHCWTYLYYALLYHHTATQPAPDATQPDPDSVCVVSEHAAPVAALGQALSD